MILSIKTQENIAGLLLGSVLLLITFLKVHWFLTSYDWVTSLYPLSIILGFFLVFFFGAKLVRIKGLYGFITLIVIEIFLYTILHISSQNQQKVFTKLPWQNIFYNGTANIMQYDPKLSEFDEALGYRYKRSVASTFSNLEFDTKITTNSLGLRDDEKSLNKPRIIALGDSYTTGWGVEDNERFSEILEEKSGLKVLNAGISSFGTVREGLLLNELDLDSCKMVIIQYCMNDYLENKTWLDELKNGKTFKPSFNKEKYNLRVKTNVALSSYTPFKYIHRYTLTILRRLFSKNFTLPKVTNSDIPEHVSLFIQGLKQIRNNYKNNILVISLSNSYNRLDPAFTNELNLQLEISGLSGIDILETSHLFKKNDIFYLDTHLNANGHAKLAEHLFKYLKDNPLK
ncbi:SGNH/GDSL hydrolase family protein [Arcticibacterium luteifluviistationis]|uniref:SGNH hydrolase-type esterase domain-containing protein n=1 Tax=Arcticibacterium luteifluviistationis TaxID=1784714 RepID=A0A2Z4GFP5_9BACT|nr:SGNH/GDSL hydrolase family protein [Arcticibacterium luteifluviistationis]AWV99991.1 hypothetical protein DJ013_18195 [Arcticibacterium luteifluviistationis]